ncbi:hypothetical protein LTR15_010124 [Elasticomyces elasticus]|nr:hypothetical protein LTR15_010124 [Elasticomyces elasticus]
MASPAYSHCDTPSSRKRRRGSPEYDEMYDMSEDEVHSSDDSESDGPPSLVNEETTDITLPEHNNAQAPAFEPEFKEIEPALRVPVDKMETIMAKHGKLSAVANGLLAGVQDLLAFQKPRLNATLRGETGSGKSGLFNSIADVAGLVKSLNAGRRGSHAHTVG